MYFKTKLKLAKYFLEMWTIWSQKPWANDGLGRGRAEMDLIVGRNRNKCKDCYDEAVGKQMCALTTKMKVVCKNTPSKHTDQLVNQHHRQHHTFKLIANYA
ncbi:hypothetical protein AQUCO_01200066v1 [Aquilegia coerulea]|uniref:Uncharacterized protein n=1 Tax=Aquilegia coerulea TaxID=218851 RepID=A0A2G5E4C9_AQUCA|nr:hypothetical protein AQUCO_01200066v1 [Aquilegia coerulea]